MPWRCSDPERTAHTGQPEKKSNKLKQKKKDEDASSINQQAVV
jgi:hypothetical protein